MATQVLIEKNKELLNISEEFISNLEKRVDAGKISPAEVSRARIIMNSLQIELNRLQSEYETRKSELMSLIYNPQLVIDSLSGELSHSVELRSYDSLLTQLDNNPKLKKV
ncbi:MAG: TolC family protein [Melioribacteraceae bacterium]|nr:TolC family protein [Melioribacteraceae bacterium]